MCPSASRWALCPFSNFQVGFNPTIAGQGVLVQQLWTEKWLVVLRTAERTPSVWALQEKEACATTGQPIDDGRLCTPTLPGPTLYHWDIRWTFRVQMGFWA